MPNMYFAKGYDIPACGGKEYQFLEDRPRLFANNGRYQSAKKAKHKLKQIAQKQRGERQDYI